MALNAPKKNKCGDQLRAASVVRVVAWLTGGVEIADGLASHWLSWLAFLIRVRLVMVVARSHVVAEDLARLVR